MKIVFCLVAENLNIHVFGRILGGTEAKAVKAERKLVAFRFVGVVFSPGVQLTEDQFPVVAPLVLVEIHRDAAAKIFHFDRVVQITGDNDLLTESLTRFVD